MELTQPAKKCSRPTLVWTLTKPNKGSNLNRCSPMPMSTHYLSIPNFEAWASLERLPKQWNQYHPAATFGSCGLGRLAVMVMVIRSSRQRTTMLSSARRQGPTTMSSIPLFPWRQHSLSLTLLLTDRNRPSQTPLPKPPSQVPLALNLHSPQLQPLLSCSSDVAPKHTINT